MAACLAVVSVPVPGASAAPVSAKRADAALNRALASLVTMRGGPPGAFAEIGRDGQRKDFNHGVANRSTGARIEANDAWRIASVSKAFNGATTLALVQRGQLSLDDTIAQRLPQLPAMWGQVTLGEALHHTGGLPDFTLSPAFVAAVGPDARAPFSPLELVQFAADEPLDFPPGTQYRYSDTDNIVVGLFIEAATGISYTQAMSSLVLDPLALRNTSLPQGWRMPLPFVHGYEGREDDSEVFNATSAWASGGMISTPPDLTRFVRAYAGGKLITGATRAAQLAFVPGSSGPPGPGVNDAGLGLFRYRTRCGVMYGHTGFLVGYTTFIGATADGRRSATVQVSTQLGPGFGSQPAFRALRRTFGLAVCAAMAG